MVRCDARPEILHLKPLAKSSAAAAVSRIFDERPPWPTCPHAAGSVLSSHLSKVIAMPNHASCQLISAKDVAQRLGVSTRTVRRLVKSGKLSAYAITSRIVQFAPADVEEFLRLQRIERKR